MAALVFFFESRRALRRERVFRDRSQALDVFNDTELLSRYRFPRQEILRLTDMISECIKTPTMRGKCIPPHVSRIHLLLFCRRLITTTRRSLCNSYSLLNFVVFENYVCSTMPHSWYTYG